MKFDFFKESTPPLIGVDISSASVKMVELSGDGAGVYRLEGYAIVPLAKDSVVDGNIAGLEQVGSAVERAWKLLSTREKRAGIAGTKARWRHRSHKKRAGGTGPSADGIAVRDALPAWIRRRRP